MKYRQLTSGDRYRLSALRVQGCSNARIARHIGCHRSTISRELRRNRSRWDDLYRPSKAAENTNGRRSRSRRNGHFTHADFRLVDRYLRREWSPEQIAGRLGRERILRISHETIYRYIWQDKREGGTLYRHLRCAQKQHRKRHRSYDSRGRLAGKRDIAERPRGAENRSRMGHWAYIPHIGWRICA